MKRILLVLVLMLSIACKREESIWVTRATEPAEIIGKDFEASYEKEVFLNPANNFRPLARYNPLNARRKVKTPAKYYLYLRYKDGVSCKVLVVPETYRDSNVGQWIVLK